MSCIMALNNPMFVEHPVHWREMELHQELKKHLLGMMWCFSSLSSQSFFLYLLIRQWSLHSCWLGPHAAPPPQQSTHYWAINHWPLAFWAAWTSHRPKETSEDESGEIAQWKLCEIKQKLCSITTWMLLSPFKWPWKFAKAVPSCDKKQPALLSWVLF